MKDNISFFNPTDIGYFDLGKTQTNKTMPFKSLQGVFDPASVVNFYLKSSGQNKRTLFKSSTIGNGLLLTGTNTVGQEKTLSLTLNGPDFSTIPTGSFLEVECSFFIAGDIEIIFEVQLK